MRTTSRTLIVAAFAAAVVLAAPAAHAFDHSHADFNGILQAHVKGGRVDYMAIKDKALVKLDGYLKTIAGAKQGAFSKDQRLAFYINAYNACVLREVIKRWPVSSVIKSDKFFKSDFCNVGGKKMSLDTLEKKTIMPEYKEPLVHFALVCAARSCPVLQSRAWTAATLKKDLEAAAKGFIRSREGVRLKNDGAALSKIFEWYAGDFGGEKGVRSFVADRLGKGGDAVRKGPLSYFEYNWKLNGK